MTMNTLLVTIACIWLIYYILRKKNKVFGLHVIYLHSFIHIIIFLKTYAPVPVLDSRARNSHKNVKIQVEILIS